MVADMVITYLFAFFWYVQPQWWSCAAQAVVALPLVEPVSRPPGFQLMWPETVFWKSNPPSLGACRLVRLLWKVPSPESFLCKKQKYDKKGIVGHCKCFVYLLVWLFTLIYIDFRCLLKKMFLVFDIFVYSSVQKWGRKEQEKFLLSSMVKPSYS